MPKDVDQPTEIRQGFGGEETEVVARMLSIAPLALSFAKGSIFVPAMRLDMKYKMKEAPF